MPGEMAVTPLTPYSEVIVVLTCINTTNVCTRSQQLAQSIRQVCKPASDAVEM